MNLIELLVDELSKLTSGCGMPFTVRCSTGSGGGSVGCVETDPPSVVSTQYRYGVLAGCPFGCWDAEHAPVPFGLTEVAPWPVQTMFWGPVPGGLPGLLKARAAVAPISAIAVAPATTVAERRRIARFIITPLASLAR